MSEYRTAEQFEEIVKSTFNGNWSQGAREAVEFGFYANDLINMQEQAKANEEIHFEDDTDIAIVIELAQKYR